MLTMRLSLQSSAADCHMLCESEEMIAQTDDLNERHKLAKVIDRICFVVFAFIYLILLLRLMPQTDVSRCILYLKCILSNKGTSCALSIILILTIYFQYHLYPPIYLLYTIDEQCRWTALARRSKLYQVKSLMSKIKKQKVGFCFLQINN